MEDYPQQDEDTEKKPNTRGKFSRGDFLSSWLQRRLSPETDAKDTSKKNSIGIKPETNVQSTVISLASEQLEIEPQPDRTTTSTAVLAGEVLRHRQEKELQREIDRLIEHTKDLKAEQEEVRLQQEAFSEQLSKQQPTEDRYIDLKQINEKTVSDYQKLPEIETAQLSTDSIKEIAISSPETKPNLIMQTVEQAAERNVPIESMYERRHEVKDETSDVTLTTKANILNFLVAKQNVQNQVAKRAKHTSREYIKRLTYNLNSAVKLLINSDMYKRAVKSGFWTAIALIVILGLLIVLTR